MKKLLHRFVDYLRHTDLILIFLCLTASSISVLALLAEAQSGYIDTAGFPYKTALVQFAATGAGMLGLLVISNIDYHTLFKLWKLHLPLCIILIIMTFLVGITVGDADDRAWLELPFGMSLQPAELLKISFTLTFAGHLSLVGSEINNWRNISLLSLHAGSMVLLVHFQGDDGTALVFGIMFVCMMLVAGLRLRYFALAGAVTLGAAPLIWLYVMNDQQRMRIMALYTNKIDATDILFQQNHAVMAIGAGETVGIGLFGGGHHYVPVMRSDFIFSFIGEATGFLGCILVLGVLFAICGKILWVSHRAADDMGRYICIGVFAMIAVQTVVNLGMNLMVLPVIGVTLPFLSAGGTSVAGLYIGIGLVVSVYMHSRTTLFTD